MSVIILYGEGCVDFCGTVMESTYINRRYNDIALCFKETYENKRCGWGVVISIK